MVDGLYSLAHFLSVIIRDCRCSPQSGWCFSHRLMCMIHNLCLSVRVQVIAIIYFISSVF